MENKKQVEYILKSPKKQGITNKIQKRIRKLSNIETLSIIEGGTYPQSVLDEILSKNIVKWFIDSHVGDIIIKKEGVARFASDNVYLYYKKQRIRSLEFICV